MAISPDKKPIHKREDMIIKKYYKKINFVRKNLSFKCSLITLLKNILSYGHYYELHANLNTLIYQRKTRIKYSLKLIDEKDIKEIIELIPSLDMLDRKEVIVRIFFYKKGFKNCYIARNQKNDILYMQWLVYPRENKLIEALYKRRFPKLDDKQVFLENAFTFPKARGLGMSWSVNMDLMELAKSEGYKHAFTFVKKENISVISDYIKMGFKIKKLVPEFKLLGCSKRFL